MDHQNFHLSRKGLAARDSLIRKEVVASWRSAVLAPDGGSGQRIEKEVCEGLHNHLFKVCFQGELGYRVLFLRQRSSHQISTSHSTSSSAHYNDIHRCWGRARANSGYQALILIRPGDEATSILVHNLHRA